MHPSRIIPYQYRIPKVTYSTSIPLSIPSTSTHTPSSSILHIHVSSLKQQLARRLRPSFYHQKTKFELLYQLHGLDFWPSADLQVVVCAATKASFGFSFTSGCYSLLPTLRPVCVCRPKAVRSCKAVLICVCTGSNANWPVGTHLLSLFVAVG